MHLLIVKLQFHSCCFLRYLDRFVICDLKKRKNKKLQLSERKNCLILIVEWLASLKMKCLM